MVGGSNGYSGKFGDEEASMLWFHGKGVAYFKESSTGINIIIIIKMIIIIKIVITRKKDLEIEIGRMWRLKTQIVPVVS